MENLTYQLDNDLKEKKQKLEKSNLLNRSKREKELIKTQEKLRILARQELVSSFK